MGTYVVWLDREHAKIFCIALDSIKQTSIQSQNLARHMSTLDQHQWKEIENRFFGDVISALATASRVLILGPGVVKHHFLAYVQEHYPMFRKKIVGCETLDHPSDTQIVAQAQKYFQMPKIMPSAE